MTGNKVIVFVSILLLNSQVFAQQSTTYTNDLVDFQKALTLYNNKQYRAAQSMFDNIKDDTQDVQIQSDCAYYVANCAVRLDQSNADDLILDFVEDYPTSTKRNTAFLDVGDYYFQNSKFSHAKKWYDRVDENGISRAEREKLNFKSDISIKKM